MRVFAQFVLCMQFFLVMHNTLYSFNSVKLSFSAPRIVSVKNQYDEILPEYVSLSGFRMLADAIFDDVNGYPGGYSHSEMTPARNMVDVNHIQHRLPIIYVNPHKLSSFLVKMAPKIRSNYVLIMSGDDSNFPDDFTGDPRVNFTRSKIDFEALLADKKISHLFISNYTGGRRDNVTPIPLGIDYHHSKVNGTVFNGIERNFQQTTGKIRSILSHAPVTSKRIKKIYMSGHIRNTSARHKSKGLLDRVQLDALLRGNPLFHFQNEWLPRESSWRSSSKYAFVFSPIGRGFDCHRVWESIALGQIVLVQSSPVDPIFEGLPVIPIKDPSKITIADLDRWLVKFGNASHNTDYLDKISMSYWQKKVFEKAAFANSNQKPRIKRIWNNWLDRGGMVKFVGIKLSA